MSTAPAREQVGLVQVTEKVLDVAQHLAAVEDPQCGAVTTFIGQVRDHDPEVPGTVTSISYSAHPDAQQVLERLVAEMVDGGAPPAGAGIADGGGSPADGPSLGGGHSPDDEDAGQEPALTPVRIAVSHRIGELAVGDVALVACVATPHRAQGFDICRTVVERIKVELPVWKKQHTADGTSQWSGL